MSLEGILDHMNAIPSKCFVRLWNLIWQRPEWFLLLLLLLLYVPFLDEPVLRTTGDEKVYVAQALEMTERGSWFQQSLAETPNYYKPPMHFLLLRVGFHLFGFHSLWAVLWMNLAAISLVLFYLVRTLRRLPLPSATGWLTGLGLLFAPGIFAHMFASQMEIELLAIYGLVLACSLQLRYEERRRSRWLILWSLIGLCSWIKSPVHSVLLALGVIGLIAVKRDLRLLYGNRFALAAPALGIFIGILSLAVPYILDPSSFYDTYVLRETFGKGANGVGALQALLPNFTFHVWPFIPMVSLGSLAVYHSYRKNLFSIWENHAVACSLFLAWPTLIFFSIHPFRSEIYMLPALPAIILWAVIGWRKAKDLWPGLAKWGHGVWLGSSLLPAILIIALYERFHPSQSWWPFGLTETAWLVLFIQTILILVLWLGRSEATTWTFLVWLPSFFLAAALMQTIGRFDLKEFKLYAQQQERVETFGFYNAHKFVWSEWGLLNFTGGIRVKGIHRSSDVSAWLATGAPLIVPRSEYLEIIRQSMDPKTALAVKVWHRWQSHGDHSRQNGLFAAWTQRRLDLLQGEYYIVRLLNLSQNFSLKQDEH